MSSEATILNIEDFRTKEQTSSLTDVYSLLLSSQTLRPQDINDSQDKLVDLFVELQSVLEESKEFDTDNAVSEPISDATYNNAIKFLKSLPLGTLPKPELAADNDGYIEFEWYKDSKSFSVYITDSNLVYFAAYYGKDNRLSGRFRYEGYFPRNYKDLARAVFE